MALWLYMQKKLAATDYLDSFGRLFSPDTCGLPRQNALASFFDAA
jgi:hypothetical protein